MQFVHFGYVDMLLKCRVYKVVLMHCQQIISKKMQSE